MGCKENHSALRFQTPRQSRVHGSVLVKLLACELFQAIQQHV